MENLKKQGWILSDSGLKSIEASGSKNLNKHLLDRDLREIGAGIGDLSKGKFENLDHDLAVLQILKIRNISAPKANESSKTAPKLLKLQLTDGMNTYSAIEMEPTALTIETKPGSKVALKIKLMKAANGQLLFTPKNIDILGGHVEALVSKWEMTKSLAGIKGSRTGAAGGPPPFIPFGQKIQQTLPIDQRGFKSLQPAKPKESENDDSEFKAQRKDAIAEASKAGTKKTFGGGSKTLVDSNVQKIMDKGYTEEQATTALRYSKNNVEKALSIIKRKEDYQKRASSNDYEPREYSKEKRGGKGGSAEPTSAKPSAAVSLFDFLENKIPGQQESTAKQSSSYSDERFENNMSSSFRKNDKDFSNNNSSQNWSQHSSGGNEHKSTTSHRTSNSYNARDRDYRGDGGRDHPRDYRNSRDSRDTRDSRDGRAEGDTRRENKYQLPANNNSYSSKPSSTANNQYQKPSNAINNGTNSSYNKEGGYNKDNNNYASKGKYQKPDFNSKSDYNNKSDYNSKPDYHNKSDYGGGRSNYNVRPGAQQQKDFNSFASSDTGNSKFDASRKRSGGNESSSAPSKYYNDSQSNDYHKSSRHIVDSMEKMNLKGSNHQPYKGADTKLNAANYPPLTPTTTTSEAPPPPKPKTYSKPGYQIVGFQNKEANEHAKNVLKTKNIPHQHQQPPHQPSKPTSNWQQAPPPPQQQQQQQPHHKMPVASQQMNAMKSQPPPPPFPNHVSQPAAPVPMHSLPQPFVQVQHQATHQVIHAMPPAATIISGSPAPVVYHQAINYQAPIIMQAPPGLPPPPHVMNSAQQLKIGDMCRAKYWEDSQFYNAKITNVSDSTYVVLFSGYGNAEEVRKTDCVPMTPACPTPPHSTHFVPAPQMSASYRIPAQKTTPHLNYHQQTPPPPTASTMPYKSAPGQRRN